MKKTLMIFLTACANVILASPATVTCVEARQRYPWNGLVDIDYTIEGDAAGLNVQITMKNKTTGVEYSPNRFDKTPPTSAGSHRVTWSTADEGLTGLVTSQMVANVSLVRHSTKQEDLYMIVDLSGGTSATTYPVTYLDSIPVGGWTDEYKTSKLVLRKIEPGTFTKGGRSTDYSGASDAGLSCISLTKAFWMGIFEVTQRQWELVMGTRPSYFSNNDCYASRPVEKVSYKMIRGSSAGVGWPSSSVVDADSFMGVLRAKTGGAFDLPTEAQWEYACRAGTRTALNSGKNLTILNLNDADANMAEVGRYNDDGGGLGYGSPLCDTSAGTAKVGSYLPNAWGLYDMHGNVWEWCLDRFGFSYAGLVVADPRGATSGSDRVLRGGGWGSVARVCCSAFNNYFSPSSNGFEYGFRLCCTSGQAQTKEELYMVVDLSGGTSVTKYAVTYLDSVPDGGWTDEYRTTKLVLRKIDPGAFVMGSPFTEEGHSDKAVQHQVSLTRGYWMGVFEVTQRQWELVMGTRPSYFSNDVYYASRPVERVSYKMIRGSVSGTGWPSSSDVDTDSFIGILRTKTGGAFDLPTEAQWEYACRAGTTSSLNKDGASINDVGRYWDNGGSFGDGRPLCDASDGTAKVGSYLPNAWGLYDMHGNVFEWCLDWWYESYTGAATDPVGAMSGGYRVIRGGSWINDASICFSARRGCSEPSVGIRNYGFRLCCSQGQSELEQYMIVDLSGGASATAYPVTYLDGIPAGGWTDEFKTTKLVLRKIESGVFVMGSPTDELGRSTSYDESQHMVELTKSFWMGVFEVTQRQWELVMGSRPSYFSRNDCYALRPVEQVSYDMIRGGTVGAGWPSSSDVDTNSFMGILRAKTGGVFDLPTEAQWEYSCRAGMASALNSGKNLTSTDADGNMSEVGRYLHNGGTYAEGRPLCETSAGTAKVGSYLPNAWGLYDMHGNVREWCLDWYGYEAYVGTVTDPVGALSGSFRVFRGGCWSQSAHACRSAYRGYFSPSPECGRYYGFRLCCLVGQSGVKSNEFTVNGRAGTGKPMASTGDELLSYSTRWEDGSFVILKQNGQTLAEELTGEGVRSWCVTRNGTYELTHTTYDGDSDSKVETATFVVTGKNDEFPPDWTPVANSDTMLVYAVVVDDKLGVKIESNGSCLAAFDKKGECRGVAVVENGPNGKIFKLPISVGSVAETGFVLLIWDSVSGYVYEVIEHIDANADKCVGQIFEPKVCTVRTVSAVNMCKVTFDLGEHGVKESGALSQSVAYGMGTVAPVIEANVGYCFVGWDKDLSSITENVTITAKYKPMVYSLTYTNLLGRANLNPTTYTVEDTVTFAALKDRVGWRFLKWNPAEITLGTTGDKIVQATWAANEYVVSLNANGGTGVMEAMPMSYDTESEITSNAFIRTGYVFAGWSTSENGAVEYQDGVVVSNLTSVDKGVVTLYAVWDKIVVPTPSITPKDGAIFSTASCLVTVDCALEGALIYFTTNGTTPKAKSSYLYTQPFAVCGTVTVKAMACKDTIKSGYATATITKVDPIPDIGDEPSAADVAAAVADAADAKIAAKIDETNYNDFRNWAWKVKRKGGDAIGAQGVMSAQNAWLSYALGSETLIENAPTDGDLTVEKFEPKSNETGKFDFTVNVKDIEIGSTAAAENLKQVFGLEGGTSLEAGDLSSENVDITFGVPENGKVKFTAGPKDTTTGTFFMRVKMNP